MGQSEKEKPLEKFPLILLSNIRLPIVPMQSVFFMVSEENLCFLTTCKRHSCLLYRISKCLGLIYLVKGINHLQREEKQQRMEANKAKIAKP